MERGLRKGNVTMGFVKARSCTVLSVIAAGQCDVLAMRSSLHAF